MAYLMKCNHVSNAWTDDNQPACVICNCTEVIRKCKGTEGLEGRKARCSDHKGGGERLADSKWELPFFEYKPNEKYDTYYCGCWGWD